MASGVRIRSYSGMGLAAGPSNRTRPASEGGSEWSRVGAGVRLIVLSGGRMLGEDDDRVHTWQVKVP
jgi:hypothetical protein